MRPITPLALDEFETQPFRISGHAELDATADAVFTELGDPSLWFPLMKRSLWKTGATSGVGAEREIDNRMFGKARERMLVWEPGKRVAFTMIAMDSPFVAKMGEDYHLTPDGDRCRVDYTIVATPTMLGRALTPALKVTLKRFFKRGVANIGKRAANYRSGKKVG